MKKIITLLCVIISFTAFGQSHVRVPFASGSTVDSLDTATTKAGVILANNVPVLTDVDTNRFQNVVCPLLFGAKGDGTTIDTLAFQEAITYAKQVHLPIYVPHGTYILPFTSTTDITEIPKFFGDNAKVILNPTTFNGVSVYNLPVVLAQQAPFFSVAGSISLVDSIHNAIKGYDTITINSGLSLAAGDILFFTSLDTLPYAWTTNYYCGQRAIVDSYNNTTGLLYIHEAFRQTMHNVYVRKNVPVNCDFGEGITFIAPVNASVECIQLQNTTGSISGNYVNFGYVSCQFSNSEGKANIHSYHNYAPGNGLSYGILVSDLSDVAINSYIYGGRIPVSGGGGIYWRRLNSGSVSDTTRCVYPCKFTINGGTYSPNNREPFGAVDSHPNVFEMDVYNANLYGTSVIMSEIANVNNCTVFTNAGANAFYIHSKDTTDGYYNIANVGIFGQGITNGGIVVDEPCKKLTISNVYIKDSSITNGPLYIIQPIGNLIIDGLDVDELNGRPSTIQLFTSNNTFSRIHHNGSSFYVNPQFDSLSVVVDNSTFRNAMGVFNHGLYITSSHVLRKVTLNNCQAYDNQWDGIYVNPVLSLYANNCVAARNGAATAATTNTVNRVGIYSPSCYYANISGDFSSSKNQYYGASLTGFSAGSYYNATGCNFTGNLGSTIFAGANMTAYNTIGIISQTGARVANVLYNTTVAGTIAATNLSGTNTGDQTITLSSDLSGTGTGTIAATIGANKVTYAKVQTETQSTLLGNPTGSTANTSAIPLGAGLAFSGGALTATGSGGTVTTFSATTTQGVAATVTNATTTPAIAIGLGNITPPSINSGSDTATNYYLPSQATSDQSGVLYLDGNGKFKTVTSGGNDGAQLTYLGGKPTFLYLPVKTVTADYSINPTTDKTIIADVGTSSITITLPPTPSDEQTFTVKLINAGGGHTVTVTAAGATSIDGNFGDTVLHFDNQAISVRYHLSDNKYWIVSSHFPTQQITYTGTATLSSGTITVSDAHIKTGTPITLTTNTPSGTSIGFLSAPSASITDGTSFVINSLLSTGMLNTADNSTVNYSYTISY